MKNVPLALPLFIGTLGALLLEICLIRIFSVVLFYHYAFLVISFSLLGLAIGGIASRFIPTELSETERYRLLSWVSMMTGVLLIPILNYILNTNIFLVGAWELFSQLSGLYLVCLIPFACFGFIIASVMSMGGDRLGVLYFFDLAGGAMGCLIFLPLIGWLGGPNTVLFVSVLCMAGGLAWAWAGKLRQNILFGAAGIVVTVLLLIMNMHHAFIDVRFMRGVPVKDEVFSKWNNFSRISVTKHADGFYWIEIDGGAGTWVAETKLEGDTLKATREKFGLAGPELAMWLADRPKTLVIGVGGGFDVGRAITAGSRAIDAVEINPIIANDVMRGKFYEYSHRLYGCVQGIPCLHPEVSIHIEDGRSFIQRSAEKYDVIQLSQVDTWASTSSGAYGLTETYLYTVNAIKAYFDHLSEKGTLSISRWEFAKPRETLRLVSDVLAALEERGIRDPEKHVVVILEKQQDSSTVRFGTVLMKKNPFTADEISRIRVQVARASTLSIAHAPYVEDGEKTFRSLILSKDRNAFYDTYEYNVTPVYDSKPFFFFTDRWSNFLSGLSQKQEGGDSVSSSAQHLLTLILLLSVAAVSLFLLVPMALFPRHFPVANDMGGNLAFCLCIGLGYIIIEISMINKFVVYLGQPIYSLTVVIFSFLVASSIGSHLSQRFPVDRLKGSTCFALVAIIIALLAYTGLVDVIVYSTLALPVAAKITIVCAVIFPLGLLMGVPFPSIMRITSATQNRGIEWSWALNAAGTVLGSVLAMFIAVHMGMVAMMFSGAVAYGAALLALKWIKNNPSRQTDQAVPAL